MSVNIYRASQDALQTIAGNSVGQIIQKSVMPTPALAELGNIYQYVGATSESYTNGYFYKCVSDNGAYVWDNISTTEITTTTTTVNSITAVGTLPTFTYNSTTENLTYTAGTLPTKGSDTSVINSIT